MPLEPDMMFVFKFQIAQFSRSKSSVDPIPTLCNVAILRNFVLGKMRHNLTLSVLEEIPFRDLAIS